MTDKKENVIWDTYNELDFIDACDNANDWLVGYIINKYEQSKTYRVRFDGWPNKYDETFKFNSCKLKPFRSEVVGYTGQKKNPGIRESWKFTLKSHLEKLENMKVFTQNILTKSSHQINQMLRGYNYFYTDFLMTTTFTSAQEMQSVINYFRINIAQVCKFLNFVDTSFKEYYASIENQQHLTDPSTAYQCSFYEIFDTFYIITGSYQRLNGFFLHNRELLFEYLKVADSKDTKKSYRMFIIQQFAKVNNGLSALDDLILKLQTCKTTVPFRFIYAFTHFIQGIRSLLPNSKVQNLVSSLIKVIDSSLIYITNRQLKNLKLDDVTLFLDQLQKIAGSINFSLGNWGIRMELEILKKMIECPYFDKKLKGITGTTQLMERKQSMLRHTGQILKTWVKENTITEKLFLSNDNVELLKKSGELFRLLFIWDIISISQIKTIWSSRSQHHEAALREIYIFIANLAECCQEEMRKKLFDTVTLTDPAQWEDDYVRMVINFTLSSLLWVQDENNLFLYGFNISYEYLLKADRDQYFFKGFVQIMEKFDRTKFLAQFIQLCFQKILDKKQSVLHYKLLRKAIQLRIEKQKLLDAQIIIKNICQEKANSEELTLKLDLLSGIMGALKKTITFCDLKKLWLHFARSQQRSIFFCWVCKKKDSGRYMINQHICKETKRQMLEQLWAVRVDLEDISDDQAQILVELFKCVNEEQGRIQRENLVIKSEALELCSMSTIWEAFLRGKNEKVTLILSHLIAQVYTSASKTLQSEIQMLLDNLVEKIYSSLKSSYKSSNIQEIKRLLVLTETLIQRDEEIYPVSQNYRSISYREFTVVNAKKNLQKHIKFNECSNFYEFKKIVADKFSIPIHTFTLSAKGEAIGYDNYFKLLTENIFSYSRFQMEEHSQKYSLVKQKLNNKLELFFQLLGDPRVQKNVWNIVSKLPIALSSIKALSDSKNPQIELSSTSVYKELYMLRVALELDSSWWLAFVQADGFSFLLSKLHSSNYKSEIEKEYFMSLSQTMLKALTDKPVPMTPKNTFGELLCSLYSLMGTMFQGVKQSLKFQIKIISNIFDIGQALNTKNQSINTFLSLPTIDDFLQKALLQLPFEAARIQFREKLLVICNHLQQQHFEQLLSRLLITLFDKVQQKKHANPREYFKFTTKILDLVPNTCLRSFLSKQSSPFVTNLYSLIQAQHPELNLETRNELLIGYLNLLSKMLDPEDKEFSRKVCIFLLEECFFSQQNSKCKTKASREAAFSLLNALMAQSNSLEYAIDKLESLHRMGKWRSRKIEDWTISLSDKLKSVSGYVGLKNLGCTCYMNSIFQQLFMVEEFRNCILQCIDPNFGEKDDLLFELKRMVLSLSISQKKFYNLKQFCNAFKNYDGQPTNVRQQMDIEEFLGILFDRVLTLLKGTPEGQIINGLFNGILSNQIVCKGCPHFSESEESFLTVGLTVKNKKNIFQSLQTMIKGDTLDGDNAYYCERCDKKVPAIKRTCFKKLPEHLILALKRFEFDYEAMNRFKVNNYCQFPLKLNLKEYSRQYLREKENHKSQNQEVYPDEYFQYVLKGIVIHFGSADSGHYYSFIQEREGKERWFQFNDTLITNFNPANISGEAFGGEIIYKHQTKEKNRNAYLLVYDRQILKPSECSTTQVIEKLRKQEQYNPLFVTIHQENIEQRIETVLFSFQYGQFAMNVLNKLHNFPVDLRKRLLQYVHIVFLTVIVRQKDLHSIFKTLQLIKKKTDQKPQLYEWIVTLFLDPRVLDEFLKNNPMGERKKLLTYWIAYAVSRVQEHTRKAFINLLLHYLSIEYDNNLEFCIILYQICRQSPIDCDFIIANKVVGRLMQNVYHKVPRLYKADSIEKPIVNSEPQLGYQTIIQKTKYQLNKKIQQNNENTYMWAIINLVIKRAIQLGKNLSQCLEETELKYLQLPPAKIFKILDGCNNKAQMKHLAYFFCYKAKNNKQFSVDLMNQIKKGLDDFISKRYRQLFYLFSELIKIDDELRHFRYSFFDKVIKAVKLNEKYLIDINIMLQWIIAIFCKNLSFMEYVAENQKENIEYLILISTKKVPSKDNVIRNKKYNEYMINCLHNIKFPKTRKKYQRLNNDITNFFRAITGPSLKITEEMKKDWEQIPEVTDLKLEEGLKMAYFDSRDNIEFEQCFIQHIFLTRITLKFPKSNNTISVWKDDEKLTDNVNAVCTVEEDLDSSKTTSFNEDDAQDPSSFP